MSVAIGIDLGTSFCCAAAVRDDAVVLVEDEDGRRTTPSIVHFGSPQLTWLFERQESILKEVSQRLGERARTLTVDIEESPALKTRFRIESAPTVIVFKDGHPTETFYGIVQADRLVAAVEGLVGQGN